MAKVLPGPSSFDKHSMIQAALEGDVYDVDTIHANGVPYDADIMLAAVRSGSVDLVRHLYRNGCPWNVREFTRAAIDGHVHILDYMLGSGLQYDADRVTRDVMTFGNERKNEVIVFLLDGGAELEDGGELLLVGAIYENNVQLVRYLVDIGAAVTTRTLKAVEAAGEGVRSVFDGIPWPNAEPYVNHDNPFSVSFSQF